MLYLLTFRGFATIAMPTNCVLSAKIKVFREERSTTQEKTSNSAKPLLYAARFPCYTVRVFQTYYISVSAFYKCKSDKDKYKLDWRKYKSDRNKYKWWLNKYKYDKQIYKCGTHLYNYGTHLYNYGTHKYVYGNNKYK